MKKGNRPEIRGLQLTRCSLHQASGPRLTTTLLHSLASFPWFLLCTVCYVFSSFTFGRWWQTQGLVQAEVLCRYETTPNGPRENSTKSWQECLKSLMREAPDTYLGTLCTNDILSTVLLSVILLPLFWWQGLFCSIQSETERSRTAKLAEGFF